MEIFGIATPLMKAKPQFELLIATRNSGKVLEISEAFSGMPVRLRQLNDFPEVTTVEEAGATYEENATLKALGYAKQTSLWTVADDSGLEVDTLGGRPGVFSARYCGESASDEQRIDKLLQEIAQRPNQDRRARFVCCMALAGWSNDEADSRGLRILQVTNGTCEGEISRAPSGSNGFGFDPVFIPLGYEKSFGELAPEVKAMISHRAKALAKMRLFISRALPQK